MYSVVEYYNNSKNLYYTTLHIYKNVEKAKRVALEYAESYFGVGKIVEGVDNEYLEVTNSIVQYTTNDGFGCPVWAVVELPCIEIDSDTEYEKNDGFEVYMDRL
jgi:hypothetical protein